MCGFDLYTPYLSKNFCKKMKCLLLWTMINIGYLYKCPSVVDQPTCCNCTTIHTGTYDQEFMVMCSESIEKPATTTLEPMEISTTTSTVSPQLVTTSTELPSLPTLVPTTTKIYSPTSTSTTPSQTYAPSYTTSTQSWTTQSSTTTENPTEYPTVNPTTLALFNDTINAYIVNKTTDPTDAPAIYNTIVNHPMDTAILITSICISAVALVGCIGLTIWTYNKHRETKTHKMVRPSQVNIEISPTAKQPMLKGSKDDIDIENQLRVNKLKMNKIRQQQGPHTDRPMMSRRPSSLKKMSVDDWRRLQAELKTKSKPQVNRKLKPPKNQFKPPAPNTNQPRLQVAPHHRVPTRKINISDVAGAQSTVKTMINKFNKK